MRPLIVNFPVALPVGLFVACISFAAMSAHAQRADSTITVDVSENSTVEDSTVIDLTNLVSLEDDVSKSDDAADANADTIQNSQDNLSEQTAILPQSNTLTDETVIDEILAEIDEDARLETSPDGLSSDAASRDNERLLTSNVEVSNNNATSLETASSEDNTSNQNALTGDSGDTTESAPTPIDDTRSQGKKSDEIAEAEAADTPTGAANPIQPTARIGRRALSNVGLVSIGLEDTNPRRNQLNSLIWQGSQAKNIIALISETPAYGPSAEMNKLVLSALLRQAVPPQGAAQMADEMVNARLSWLANSGRSDALAQLIRKLPDDEVWQDWQRWLVEYDLLTGNDADACRKVALAVSETLEPFWHQAQIVCQILSGNSMQAGFTADIVQASGLADAQFMTLVNLFLGRTETVELDNADLTPLHLILMDVAHLDMSQEQIAQLPVSFLQARSALRYLQRDAQLSVSFQALALGLTDLETTAELLRSQYVAEQSIIQAAARIGVEDEALTGLVRSNLYVQLDGSFNRGRDVAEFDTLITEALRFEASLDSHALLMPLYADLITKRLNAAELPTISADVASDFAIWQALARPEEPLAQIAKSANSSAEAYRAVLNFGADMWSPEVIEAAAGWDWLPLIEARGATQADIPYQTLLDEGGVLDGIMSRPIHPFHIFALEKAASEAGIGEVVLLSARALAGQDLAKIDSTDLANILAIMHEVGLGDSADIIAEEALRARMMDRYFAANR